MQASFLNVKLENLNKEIIKRRKIAKYYLNLNNGFENSSHFSWGILSSKKYSL